MPPEILEAFRRSLPPGTCDDAEKLQAMLAEGIMASGYVIALFFRGFTLARSRLRLRIRLCALARVCLIFASLTSACDVCFVRDSSRSQGDPVTADARGVLYVRSRRRSVRCYGRPRHG